MAPLCFTSVGNLSQAVSYSAWLYCVSPRQETFRLWSPTRHGFTVFHLGRKLFAHSFLSDIAPLCFTPAGNLLQTVSCPTWLHCASHQQETFRIQFPIRHSSIAFHLSRKPFANSFLSAMAPLCFTPTGNFSLTVSHSTWHHTYLASHLNLPKWPGRDKIEKYECM